MAEIIVVRNKPQLNELLKSQLYKKNTVGNFLVLEDFNGIKARCDFNEKGELEYIYDHVTYDSLLFAKSLTSRFDVFWIEQNDLLDYNTYAFNKTIEYSQFLEKLESVMNDLGIKIKYKDESEYLWKKLSNTQRARVLPKGYLRNYLHCKPVGKRDQLNLLELLDDSLKDRISFGIIQK